MALDLKDRATVQALVDAIQAEIDPLGAQRVAIDAELRAIDDSLADWREYRTYAQRGLAPAGAATQKED